MMTDVQDRIRRFIRQEMLFEDNQAELTNQTPLLSGVVDSLSLMQLIAFIEGEFGIEIDDTEITREHFNTVDEIAGLISRKTIEPAR